MTNKNILHNLSLEDEIDLRSSKKLIILTTLFFTLISAVYYYSLEPVYDSSSSVNLSLLSGEKGFVDQNILALREKYSELNIEKGGLNDSVLYLSINNHSSLEEFETLQEATNFAVMSINKFIHNQKNIGEVERKLRILLNDISEQYELEVLTLTELSDLERLTNELKRLSFIDRSLPGSEGLEVHISKLHLSRDKLTELSELERLTNELKRLSFIDRSLPGSEGLEVRISTLELSRDKLTDLSELERLTNELKKSQNCKIHNFEFSDLRSAQTRPINTAGAKCSSQDKEFDLVLAGLLDTHYIENNHILKEASMTQKDLGIKIKILIGAVSGFFISLLFAITRQVFYHKKKF